MCLLSSVVECVTYCVGQLPISDEINFSGHSKTKGKISKIIIRAANINHLCIPNFGKRRLFFLLSFILKSGANLLIQIQALNMNLTRSSPWSGTQLECERRSLTLQHGIGLQQLFLDLVHLLALPTHRCHIWHHQLTGLWSTDTQINIRVKPLLDMAEEQVWRAHPSHHSP